LITAGPTYEAIDPVRFIGNHSSGKMGYALAEKAAERGAIVTLISGPVNQQALHSNILTIKVVSAAQMYESAMNEFQCADIAIMSAAVADFTPLNVSLEKIKDKQNQSLELIPTKDIAQELGRIKTSNQLLIGFALETNNELENAKLKLRKKNFDLIVLNSLQDKNAGFQFDTNKITIIGKDNIMKEFELKPKELVAIDILNEVEKIL